ncbi:MAG TPA: VOC family protein [Acetobacteraceae bacterium]|jgi:2,3-dihydroxy-p-cumate/2,3-dihydroxybenzoate 3,4-dioxygenase|nr:VOC family protein [Acetobacteraceae bacterium]
MINLHDIRYARLGTPDLEMAIKFATDFVGLQLVAREGQTAYFRSDKAAMRGDTRDHTLVYFEGDPTDHTTGLELDDPDDLDAVGAALEYAERPIHWGTQDECEARRVRAFIATSDPSGNKIEILARPHNSGVRFFPGRDVDITGFSHLALFSTDPKRDTAFWTDLCNARVSDWLGDATFLRIGTVHHSVVLMPSSRPGIQHLNHQVEDVDDVMRSYYWLKQQGVKIVYGPGRHPISTAIMVYFEGPDGMVYEYSTGVKHILPEQEANYRPRQFSLEGYNGDMWGSFTETDGLPREPAAGRRMRLVV